MGTIKSRIEFLNPPVGVSSTMFNKALLSVAEANEYQISVLVFHYVSREKIQEINLSFLNHDYATDIITFSYGRKCKVKGDIFICDEIVIANANDRGIALFEEQARVVFHGLLHLIGFNDTTETEIQEMRLKEDECIKTISSGK